MSVDCLLLCLVLTFHATSPHEFSACKLSSVFQTSEKVESGSKVGECVVSNEELFVFRRKVSG